MSTADAERISFSPPLPAEKRALAEATSNEGGMVLLMQWKTPWWRGHWALPELNLLYDVSPCNDACLGNERNGSGVLKLFFFSGGGHLRCLREWLMQTLVDTLWALV